MTLYRRSPRRDLAEESIIDTLEALGWSVQQLSIAGGPDLLLGRAGQTVLAEVKSGNEPLNENQIAWQQRWNGSPVAILRTVQDACDLARAQWPAIQQAKAKKTAQRKGV